MTGDAARDHAAATDTEGHPQRDDGPARISNERLVAVATAFAVAVGALALARLLFPAFSHPLGVATLACIGVYLAFGAVTVYRAGQRL